VGKSQLIAVALTILFILGLVGTGCLSATLGSLASRECVRTGSLAEITQGLAALAIRRTQYNFAETLSF